MNRYHIISIAVLTAIFCFEQYFPNRKRIPYWWKHLRRNCFLGGFNGFLTGLSSAALSVSVLSWIEDNSIGLLRIWDMPNWLMFSLAFLMFDFWIYGWHWVNHKIPFLWRFHRVHHNDPAMDMSTALRFHPGEIMLSSMLNVIIIALLGMKIEHLIIYKGVFHSNVLLQHSNINISNNIDCLIRIFFVSPNMHRIHHSNVKEETDSNYSSVFSFWDRIFGTYCRRDTKDVKFGLEQWMEQKWQTIKGLLVLPLQNKK